MTLLTTHPWSAKASPSASVAAGGSLAPDCGTYSVANGQGGSVRLCIGAANGTLQVSGGTSLQDIPSGCQVTYYFNDDTTQTKIGPQQYSCQGGTDQAFPTLTLTNPTVGDQYQPLVEITWDNGGNEQILGPQLAYGQ